MKAAVKYSLFFAVIAAAVTLISLACIARNKELQNIACNDIKVAYADTFRFTLPEQIQGTIRRDCAEVLGRNVSEIDLARIENVLERKSCIREAEAWVTMDGKLHVRVAHRIPAVKFIKNGSDEFYSDREVALFPKTKDYEPLTPQVTLKGELPDRKWILRTIDFLDFCSASKGWRGRVSGIEADRKGNLSFRLDDKEPVFKFGQPERFTEKFNNIITYFNSIAPGHEYKCIDLSCEGQIICK